MNECQVACGVWYGPFTYYGLVNKAQLKEGTGMKMLVLLAALVSVASGERTDRRVRVFVGESATWEASSFNVASASGSANWQSAQSSAGALGMSHAGIVKRTIAVMKALDDHCKTVVVVDRPDSADYFVRLDHNRTMWAPREDMAVFNRAGEMVFVSSTHSVSKDVKRFCESPVFSSAAPFQEPQAGTPAQKEAPPTTDVAADQAEPPDRAQPIIVPVVVPAIPNSGLVPMTFASNPPGAVVSFSRMGVCYTPCVTKLEPNRRYAVKMILAGYADWTSDINVEAGKPATVFAELQRLR